MTLAGQMRRLGCKKVRAFSFGVDNLMPFVLHTQSRLPSLLLSTVTTAVVYGVFGLLRAGELLRLRWLHVTFHERHKWPHIMIHLDWTKQDPDQVGADVMICWTTQGGFCVAEFLIQLRAQQVRDGVGGGDEDHVFTDPRTQCAMTSDAFLTSFRGALTQMVASGEPTLDGVDLATITTKSLKRGGTASAAAKNHDLAAIRVHGWISRRAAESLKAQVITETYSDVDDAMASPERRHRVTYLMA